MSILSYGSMSFRQGGWHVMNVLELSVPTFLFAFALLTIPACCVVLYVSDHILELVNDGDTFQSNGGENLGIVINHFFWSAETTMRIPDITPFLMNAILREVTYCLVGSVSFCLIAYRGAKREYSLAALIAGSGVSFSFFVVGVGFHVFYLDNVYNVTAIEEPVLRAIVGIFTWLPCMVGMYASLFPREARLRTLLYFVATLVGATVLYYCWRLLCMTYFFIPSPMSRVVVGIVAPSLMFTLGVQLFVPVAISLYEHTNLHAALLLLLQPLYWGATMCSVVALTSDDLVTGASIELGCLIFKNMFKVSLLHGYTPIDTVFVRTRAFVGLVTSCVAVCIRWFTRQNQTTARMSAVVPEECISDSPAVEPRDTDLVRASISERSGQSYALGATPVDGTDEAHMEDKKNELAMPASREELRKILFVCAVRYSSLVEVVAHLLSAAFVILVMANPNEVSQPPLPVDRVLGLLFLKLFLELSTDITIACCALARSAPRSRLTSYDDLRKLKARRVHMDICLLTVFFAIDAHTLLAQFLCPGSTSAVSRVSFLGSLLETRRVGVVGQCPSPLL
eukprot:TRINITY_DN10646_c0_g1_i7.p1 TRINITY_DN10646_c0_g1~~TRINITY_DN10646_c0_g1_i7.p1  ORF type:complete len:567 (-),score=50.78 TRINITY_DN10646_c0_g1_i7:445-2145(-)